MSNNLVDVRLDLADQQLAVLAVLQRVQTLIHHRAAVFRLAKLATHATLPLLPPRNAFGSLPTTARGSSPS